MLSDAASESKRVNGKCFKYTLVNKICTEIHESDDNNKSINYLML